MEDKASSMPARHLQHVAIIMDGNRRWAKQRGLPGMAGHAEGVRALKRIVRAASDAGLLALTVYAFSTENWQRPGKEVDVLLTLFARVLSEEVTELHEAGVRIRFIGDPTPFPEGLQRCMQQAQTRTQHNTGLTLQIATNYGGRAELIRGIRRLLSNAIAEGQTGPALLEAVTEAALSACLDTAGLPDPDLLIRTGGEYRISNYLLWQVAYTEFWVTPKLWPAFTVDDFASAIASFHQRDRRFGQ